MCNFLFVPLESRMKDESPLPSAVQNKAVRAGGMALTSKLIKAIFQRAYVSIMMQLFLIHRPKTKQVVEHTSAP